MRAIATVLIFPFVVLNFLGGIASGIWLAVLGEWGAIGYGLLTLVASSFALAIIMMPSLIFAGPAMMLFEKGKLVLAFPLLLLSQIYTYGVISIWCLSILFFFVNRSTPDTFWPLLIWSYGIALGPWMYMAQKEMQGGSDGSSSMTVLFAQIAYVSTALVGIFTHSSFSDLAIVFGGIMLIGMLIQTGIAMSMAVFERRTGAY